MTAVLAPWREWPGPVEGDYGPEAPVPIFQHEWEFSRLLELYKARAPRRVLEIGTYHGGTLWHWLRANPLTPPLIVVSVDSYAVGVDNRHLYQEWRSDPTVLIAICGDSRADATVQAVRDHGPFDWIFIDAGHYYDEVREDFEHYAPLCRKGGVIALHDILTHPVHPEIEVERCWRDVQRRGWLTQEIVLDPRNSWGGIGVVYT